MPVPSSLLSSADAAASDAVPLALVSKATLPGWLEKADPARAAWVRRIGFEAAPGSLALFTDAQGALAGALAGVAEKPDLWALASLPAALPQGRYRLSDDPGTALATDMAIGWALATYQFTRYRASKKRFAELVVPESADRSAIERTVAAVRLVRDLVNTPCEDMGPPELAAAASRLADEFGARTTIVSGQDLLDCGYPMVHAVGRAAAKPPCMIDLVWGRAEHPKVTLVGKGVCFDTGGLCIKGAANMLMMKKDMGGGAHALALGRMIMQAGLPVRLRILVPAVENAIAGNAFRPLDIFPTRKGLTVEIANTDAEGRLILCDALAAADEEKPDLLIDFATLTGAARVALGADLPALFTSDDALAEALAAAAKATSDPLWRLPLWPGYAGQLDSKVADLNNAPSGGFAGAITAALFLEKFVSPGVRWAHVDLYAWNATNRPGRPEGGEAMTLRAFFRVIADRYRVGAA
jgi:leucyl aminopeptidase